MYEPSLAHLREVIRTYESAITAFSAGVDSTLVAVVAQQELGTAALAATAVSASLAPAELEDALSLARTLGLAHRLVDTREVEDERYATNPTDRCYFCKTHLYTELEQLARELNLPTIYPYREYVELGGLMAYAVDLPDAFRHGAQYVDQILKGANPSDLPVYQQTRFQFLINLKTAKALNLNLGTTLVGSADEVIE